MSKETEIIAIIDYSSSMGNLQAATINGFNSFLQEQQSIPGLCRMSFYSFATDVQCKCSGIPIAKVPALNTTTYFPNGMTALLDGIGEALTREGERIARQGTAEVVTVLVITDGEENSSEKFNNEQIRTMIQHAEKHGWNFVFQAANQDAFAAAKNMGISTQYASNFAATAQGVQGSYTVASTTMRNLRTGA